MSTAVTTIPLVKPDTVVEKKPISYQTLLLGAGKVYAAMDVFAVT